MRVEARVIPHGALEALDRLSEGADSAVKRALLKIGFKLGRRTVENIEGFKQTVGTRRLSRSFLRPLVSGAIVILGAQSPVYAAIHEYGGTIKPKDPDGYLTFQIGGQWVSVKEVTISEKRYARDAIDSMQDGEAPRILGNELAEVFNT